VSTESKKAKATKLKELEKAFEENWKNPMRHPYLEKVVLNIGVGTSGEELERASMVLEDISKQKPAKRMASKSVKEWGIRKGTPIGVMVTIRGESAEKLLKRLLIVYNNRILRKSFDDYGNFSFGIEEHISIPNIEYDNTIGIWGLNVTCRIVRKGIRIRTRRKKRTKVKKSHYVSKEEAQYFMRKFFKAKLVQRLEMEYI
jgi:large subunit ribosomal protein L5